MSGSKFFIWGGERWRELNTETGQVEGWFRRARFLSVRRGRLRVCARRRVLSALQSHAVGQPSAVSLGPRLSMLSKESVSPRKENSLIIAPPVPCGHHHCCLDTHRCHTNNNCGKTCHHDASTPNDWSARNGGTTALANGGNAPDSTPITNDAVASLQRCNVSTQQTVDIAIQHAPRDHRPFSIHLAEATGATSSSQRHIRNSDSQKSAPKGPRRVHSSRAPKLDALLSKHASPIKRPRAITSDSEDSEKSFRKPSKTKRKKEADSQEKVKETRAKTERSGPTSTAQVKREQRSDSESSADAHEVCKELTISESDVLALRSYVARTRRDALARFDADDAYKRMLFYAINPLVDVERCAHTEKALRERHAMALPHYAARLGLVPHGSLPVAPPSPRTRPRGPVRYYGRASSPDTDKENKQNTKRNDKKRDSSNTKTVLRNKPDVEDSDSNDDYNVFKKSSDKKRGSTPKKTKNRVEDSDSDDESDLFENSRDHRAEVKSSKQKKPQRSGSETEHRQNVKVRDKEPHSRKSTPAGKKVSATEESDNDKILSSRLGNEGRYDKNNKYDKNRNDSPHKKTNRNTDTIKNRHESNHKSNERKREAKSDTDDTENDKNRETLKKRHDKRENRTSSDKRRESLRHRNVNQIKTSSDDSESDDKSETLKKTNNKRKSPTGGNIRGILRHKNVNQTKTSSDDSDTDEEREKFKKSDGKSRIRTSSGNRRQVLRHKSVDQSTTSSDDSESDEKRKTVEKNKGKRENRAPTANKREALRHRPVSVAKTSSDYSDSDEKRETVRKNEAKRGIRTSSGNRREVLRHKTEIQTTTTADDSESDEKRKTDQKSEAKRENRPPTDNRRESLRHRPINQIKTSTDESAGDEKRKTVEKNEGKRENRAPSDNKIKPVHSKTKESSKATSRGKAEPVTVVAEPKDTANETKRKTVEKTDGKRENLAPSNNRRESLRHRPMNDARNSSGISDSYEKRETVKRSESKRDNRAPSDNKRESLRSKPTNHTRTSSDISDSDEQSKTVKKTEAKSENRATSDNRRESLRHRSVNNTKTVPDDSKSDEKRKNLDKNEGKRENPAPSNSTTKAVAVTSKTKQPAKATNHEQTKSAVAEPKEINTKRVSNSKLKEYSNLEDHAIVAWVANGARARRVNGNALWRELQDDFARLAGNSRSWHSLRNRYLRYILPAMGAMRLPPAEVSRLRAAAATGEIKHKRAGGISKARRNSIFNQPSVKAASRPKRVPPSPAKAPPSPAKAPPSPPPAPTDSSDEPSEAGPSGSRSSYFVAPREYPDVRESPRDQEEASTSTSRRRSRRSQVSLPTPPPPQSSRGRKLFNPKQVL